MAPDAADLAERPSAGTAVPWAPACVAAVLLLGIALDVRSRDRAADSGEYHARVRAAAASVPHAVGDWVGREVPSPPSAVEMLRPNVLVNRRYENLLTGETAGVLFVHCVDARDLLGHYPPICYRASGRTLRRASFESWDAAGRAVEGMRYRFSGAGLDEASDIVVDNFMVLPDGGFGRDMDAVDRVARDPRLRHFGAAEVQVLTDGTMSDARRDEVFRELVGPAMALVDSVAQTENGE